MLTKSNRLSRVEFSHYFKTGKRFHTKTGTLIVTPHEIFRGAVVVSKKVSKHAARRNTLRRRVYAQLYKAFKNKKTGVFIILLKPLFNDLSRTEQHEEIKRLIELAT